MLTDRPFRYLVLCILLSQVHGRLEMFTVYRNVPSERWIKCAQYGHSPNTTHLTMWAMIGGDKRHVNTQGSVGSWLLAPVDENVTEYECIAGYIDEPNRLESIRFRTKYTGILHFVRYVENGTKVQLECRHQGDGYPVVRWSSGLHEVSNVSKMLGFQYPSTFHIVDVANYVSGREPTIRTGFESDMFSAVTIETKTTLTTLWQLGIDRYECGFEYVHSGAAKSIFIKRVTSSDDEAYLLYLTRQKYGRVIRSFVEMSVLFCAVWLTVSFSRTAERRAWAKKENETSAEPTAARVLTDCVACDPTEHDGKRINAQHIYTRPSRFSSLS